MYEFIQGVKPNCGLWQLAHLYLCIKTVCSIFSNRKYVMSLFVKDILSSTDNKYSIDIYFRHLLLGWFIICTCIERHKQCGFNLVYAGLNILFNSWSNKRASLTFVLDLTLDLTFCRLFSFFLLKAFFPLKVHSGHLVNI